MIVSDLKNSSRIELLHPLFKQLFDYVKQHNLLKTELGRITLDGDNLFINNVDLDGVKKEKQVLELHRKYIDVHIPLSGKETIGWKPLEKLENEVIAYERDSDCALYSDMPTAYVDIYPGEFVIVYPEDPHAPAIAEGKIRKLIAKVRVM